MRTIILHYHLFKNAGTSLDRILQKNFGDGWVTAEFEGKGGDNSGAVADWIASTPDAVAYSSHTMLGPVPQVDGVRVVPIVLLRDPIERIKSAYRFERKQQADTWGAQLAKQHDLAGYVRGRLARPKDRQCRNFQTARLASMCPGDAPELDRALQAVEILRETGVIGRVEAFDNALAQLSTRLHDSYPEFTWESTKANVSKSDSTADISDDLNGLLEESNRDDAALCNAVLNLGTNLLEKNKR